MKKMYLLLFLMLLTRTHNVYAQEAEIDNTADVSIPCLQAAFDTDDAVVAWGVGQSSDRSEASSLAVQDAIESLARRFHIEVQEVSKYAETKCRYFSRNANDEIVAYTSIGLSKSVLFRLIKDEHKYKTIPKQKVPKLEIPCMEESYDNMEELRALGIGEDATNAMQAKQMAIEKAVEELTIKAFPEAISYTNISKPNGQHESHIEINVTKEQKQFIYSNIQMQCYKIQQNERGMYQAYVAVSISLAKIKQYKQ